VNLAVVLTFIQTFGLALVGALVFDWAGSPLPWLLGPLITVAGARMLGAEMICPTPARSVGQWVIGVALGLYFTPLVFTQMAALWWAVLFNFLWAWVIGLTFASILCRIGGLDPITAFFAGAIGGASEMTIQSDRHGARVELVAAIHSLRVLIVVVSLPFIYQMLNLQGMDARTVSIATVDTQGLLILAAATISMALVFVKWNAPNAWMLGPLLVTVVLSGSGVPLSGLPEWLIKLGQVFIGMALGSRFQRESMKRLRSLSLLVTISSFGLILLAAGFAWLLGGLAGVPVATMVLATSPGGIAEMSLTAKLLQLGVPVVVVFHVTRLAFILMTVGPLYRWLAQRYNWASQTEKLL